MDPANPLSWILPIAIIIVLVFISAFFSLAETAFTCMNQFSMKVKAEEGSKSAKIVLKLHEKFDNTLITVLIGHNVVAVFVSAISTLFFVWFFKFVNIGEDLASFIATIVMTIIVYLFGDTIPKFIGKAAPNKSALTVARIVRFFYIIFKPFSLIFEGLTWLFNKIFRVKEKPTLTEEEFSDVVESIEEKGLLEENESDIIQNSLEFDDTSVKEILTPIENVFALNINDLTNEKLSKILVDNEYSRIPVYDGDIDNVIGILHVRMYLKKYFANKNTDIRKALQKPYFISNKVMIDDLFEGFSKHKTHIAIVKNYNKVLGMVTMEDVLEELVGKISEPNPKRRKTK